MPQADRQLLSGYVDRPRLGYRVARRLGKQNQDIQEDGDNLPRLLRHVRIVSLLAPRWKGHQHRDWQPDPAYLFGEGAERMDGRVPAEGYANQIFGGWFNVEFCESEIEGVTNNMPILHKGKRCQGDSSKVSENN